MSVGSRGSREWMCNERMKTWEIVLSDLVAMARTSTPSPVAKPPPQGQAQWDGKAFLWSECDCWQGASTSVYGVCAKTSKCSFLFPDTYSPRLLTNIHLVLRRPLPLCCPYKHAMFWVACHRTCTCDRSFSLPVSGCLSFLHSLEALVRSRPQAALDTTHVCAPPLGAHWDQKRELDVPTLKLQMVIICHMCTGYWNLALEKT